MWTLFFGGFFVIANLLAFLVVSHYPEFVIDSESARELVSTSIQIQATILAIVISLTLLAVEMTASKYSSRVIEIFKNNVYMWAFFYSYFISITLGTIFIMLINSLKNSPEYLTFGTLSLSIFGSFLIFMLIPYVRLTLDLLNARITLVRLAQLITVKTIRPSVDPFQALFDVIYGAIRNFDFTTMSEGLLAAQNRFKQIIVKIPDNVDPDYIAFRFFDDMKRCAFLLIDMREEKYVFEVVTRLRTISKWAIEEQDSIVLNQAIRAIEEVGSKAIASNLISPARHSNDTLKNLVIDLRKREIDENSEFPETPQQIIEALGNIGAASIRHHEDEGIRLALTTLDTLFRSTTASTRSDIQSILKEYDKLARICIEENNISSVRRIVFDLKYLAIFSIRNKRGDEANDILGTMKKIGRVIGGTRSFDERTTLDTLQDIEDAWRWIAQTADRDRNDAVTRKALEYLTDFTYLYPESFRQQRLKSRDSVPVFKKDYNLTYESFDATLLHNNDDEPPDDLTPPDPDEEMIYVS